MAAATAAPVSPPDAASAVKSNFKETWLGEIRKAKMVFYSAVVAQAQKIEVTPDQITFTFADGQRALREHLEQQKAWLETLTQQVSGRRIRVTTAGGAAGPPAGPATAAAMGEDKKAALKKRALEDAGVQALLEVLPAEIRDVEEI